MCPDMRLQLLTLRGGTGIYRPGVEPEWVDDDQGASVLPHVAFRQHLMTAHWQTMICWPTPTPRLPSMWRLRGDGKKSELAVVLALWWEGLCRACSAQATTRAEAREGPEGGCVSRKLSSLLPVLTLALLGACRAEEVEEAQIISTGIEEVVPGDIDVSNLAVPEVEGGSFCVRSDSLVPAVKRAVCVPASDDEDEEDAIAARRARIRARLKKKEEEDKKEALLRQEQVLTTCQVMRMRALIYTTTR